MASSPDPDHVGKKHILFPSTASTQKNPQGTRALKCRDLPPHQMLERKGSVRSPGARLREGEARGQARRGTDGPGDLHAGLCSLQRRRPSAPPAPAAPRPPCGANSLTASLPPPPRALPDGALVTSPALRPATNGKARQCVGGARGARYWVPTPTPPTKLHCGQSADAGSGRAGPCARRARGTPVCSRTLHFTASLCCLRCSPTSTFTAYEVTLSL